MATFKEATARLFGNVYICKKCEHKNRFSIGKFLAGKVSCRNCKSNRVRPVRMRSKK